jgi:signal transduction histidine kinase
MENLDYVKELLTELSDYSNAGRLSLTDTDMHDFLNRIAASLKPTLDYLGISMETRLSPALPVLPVDQVKLKQALLNLLRNAQESISHSRGQICLGAAAYHNGIRITIEDNGCGIPAEKLSDIFLPFVTTKPTGSGLGLAVTRQIIEAHRGSIQVESTPGQGTCFRIFLG